MHSTEIDHCARNPCRNGGSCTNSHTGYSCACATGYTGHTCDKSKISEEKSYISGTFIVSSVVGKCYRYLHVDTSKIAETNNLKHYSITWGEKMIVMVLIYLC